MMRSHTTTPSVKYCQAMAMNSVAMQPEAAPIVVFTATAAATLAKLPTPLVMATVEPGLKPAEGGAAGAAEWWSGWGLCGWCERRHGGAHTRARRPAARAPRNPRGRRRPRAHRTSRTRAGRRRAG